jgi:hypothetical protein
LRLHEFFDHMTCALLGLAHGGGELSEAALRRIEAAPVGCISAIMGTADSTHGWFVVPLEHHNIEGLPLGLKEGSAPS